MILSATFRDHARNAKSPDVPGAVYIEGDLVIVMARDAPASP
jgi:hypothetical protein